MTNDDIAAGLFKLAKAHRRAAHNMRVRANRNVKANRLASDAIKANARNASNEVRLRALQEDMKAAFLKRGALLAKAGADMMRLEAEFGEPSNEWSFGFEALGRKVFGAISIFKTKGTTE